MTWLYIFLASLPLSLFVLWVFYLAVMNLARVRGLDREDKNRAEADPSFVRPEPRMTPFVTGVGTFALLIGYTLDFYVNVFVMTPVLLEWPQEGTVTARLKRHNGNTYRWHEAAPWAKAVVRWFGPLLNPYDPKGKHI